MTKLRLDEWNQSIYQTGWLAAAVATTSEVGILVAVRSIGTEYQLNVLLTKEESNVARAVLETQYAAAPGNQFVFGFKEGGSPLTFTADQATSSTSATMMGKLNTRVLLTVILGGEELQLLKDSLASRQVDVVRVTLSNLTIEKGVNDGNGRRLKQKVDCFIKELERRGVDFSAAGQAQRIAPDAATAPREGGAQGSGEVNPAALTSAQVIQMVVAKLSDEVIITTVRNVGVRDAMTPEALIELKSAGVSDAVINAMATAAAARGGETITGDQAYLGEWVSVKDQRRWAKVFREGQALIWEDNEGKNPARIEGGQLKVSTVSGDIVIQYVATSARLIGAGDEFMRKPSP